jgi:hypothetical protein
MNHCPHISSLMVVCPSRYQHSAWANRNDIMYQITSLKHKLHACRLFHCERMEMNAAFGRLRRWWSTLVIGSMCLSSLSGTPMQVLGQGFWESIGKTFAALNMDKHGKQSRELFGGTLTLWKVTSSLRPWIWETGPGCCTSHQVHTSWCCMS